MNKLRNTVVSFCAVVGLMAVASPSHALLIEPLVGYGTSTLDAGTSDDNPSTLYYGLRLGTDVVDLGFASLFAAVDYKTGNGEFDLPIVGKSDFTHTMTGIDVGLDLPLIRAWMGYLFTNTIAFDNALYGDDFEGDGVVSLGLGLGLIPFIEINVEYFTSEDSGTDLDFLMVGVSVPLDI